MAAESSMVMALAETHKHPVCGASCRHSDAAHPDVEWTALTQDDITAGEVGSQTINGVTFDYYTLSAGNYYLAGDISIDKVLKTDGEVNLCFNGHTITSTFKNTNSNIGSLIAYSNFNACDCGSGGGFTNRGQYVLLSWGTTVLYGGKFCGENPVYVYVGTLTLDGAALEATRYAVDVQPNAKVFIKSGSATSSGYSTVMIYKKQTAGFTMSGGTVTNTSNSGSALCFSYDGVGTITGGTITAQGSSGKGVEIDNRASVVLSGSPAISGGGADIVVAGNSKITADGLTDRYSISYAWDVGSITEAAPVAFTVVASEEYSAYFAASDALGKSGLALRKSAASGDEQTVEIYRPHKFTHCAEVPATCTADGTGEYWKCTNKDCGKMFSDADGTTEITGIPVNSALGHNKEGNVAHKDATCTETGVTGGIYCTRCDDGKAAAETVIPATGHASDSGTVTTLPACTQKGTKTYKCKVCQTVLETEEIDATGHDYNWSITKTPTMTAGGSAAGVCRNDNSHKETKTLPVLSDTTVWTAGSKVEPTTDRDGSQTYTSEYGTVTVTFPSYEKIVAAAKPVVEDAIAGITATNATTEAEILGVINTALGNAGITGVTVIIEHFRKQEATTTARGGIAGDVLINCGGVIKTVKMDKPIAQLTAGKYMVAVNNGTGGGEYAEGSIVTITADAPVSGKQFDKWVVNSGNVTLADSTSSTTTFTMPAEAVSVTATYKDKPGGGNQGGGSGGGNTGGDNQGGGNSGGSGGNSGGGHSGGSGNSGSSHGGNNGGVGTTDEMSGGGNQGGGSDGNNQNGSSSGNGGAGSTSGTAAPAPAGQPKVKQEKEGNIQKEVKVTGENTLDASMTAPVSELADTVLTQTEKQQAAEGTAIRIVLDVKDASAFVSAADKAAVEAALGSSTAKGYTLGQYLDVSLYKVIGDSRNIITQTNGKIRVTIDVPDSLKNTDGMKTRTFAVIRVHDGKAVLLTDLDNDEDTVTIETDRFSTYAIVYQDTANADGGTSVMNLSADSENVTVNAKSDGGQKAGGGMDDEPQTGDSTPIELSATLAMIAGFTYLLLYFADRKRGMTEETKKELVSQLIGWGKQGGKIRKYLALAAIFVLLVYYHSIGKKTCVEWKEIYGE